MRHYYRCTECLGVAVMERYMTAGLQCDCGSTSWEYMGRVVQDRLVRNESTVPCDARCTEARGPSCDCSCGGKYHGSGLVVEVLVDVGSVRRVKTREDVERRRRIAEEWRALRAEARAAYEALRHRNIPEEFRARVLLGLALRTAQSARTHKRRMKRLREALALYAPRPGQ